MADVTINFRARNEARREIGDLTSQLETLRRLVAEGVATAIQNSIDALAAHTRQTVDTRDHIAELAEAQEVLNDFWRQASGELPDYASEVERVGTTVIDLTAAERALSAAVASNVDLISVAIAGEREKQSALAAAVEAYERAEVATRGYELSVLDTAEAALDAERRIASVGRAINAADPSRAEGRLRDYDAAFELSSVSVPRLTSAMREFTGTLPSAETEIRDTTIELENLSSAARDAARDADFLNASIADIEAFDPRVPGRRSRRGGFDTDRFALRQGERVASTAIGLGGDLLRAEEQRVASIEDLERRTSERILAINERKAEQLGRISERIAEAERRRLAAIEQAFADAKDAEIAARQEAADTIAAIEASALAESQARQRQHYQTLRALEADLAEDIARIQEGFTQREERRAAERTAIIEGAAAERLAAERSYTQTVIEINRGLVDTVRELRSDLAERLASLDAGLVEREALRASALVAIAGAAADARLAAETRYAETVIQINRNLVEQVQGLLARRVAIETGLVQDLEALNAGFTEREASRAAELLALNERDVAVARERNAERLALEATYADRVVEINRGLVLAVEALQSDLSETLAEIDAGLVEREASRADALVAIARDAAGRRVAASERYADRIADINRGLVRDVREVQADIVRIEREALRAREDVIAEASDGRRAAETAYADRVQRIYNDLAGEIEGIERNLSRTLERIRDRRFTAEADRIAALGRLERETTESVEDRQLELGRDIQDIVIENDLRDDITASELGRIFSHRGVTDVDRILGTFDETILERIATLRREFFRDIEDIERESGRERVDIDERAARETSEFVTARDTAITEAEQAAAASRADAEARAGVDAETAIANAVPALSEMARAALAFSETISGIDADELTRLAAIDTESTEALADARARIAELETEAGTTFQTALANLVPEVDASTRALNAFTAVLAEIAVDSASRRDAITVAGALDRETTASRRAAAIAETDRQVTELERQAGVSFADALENFVPAVDALRQALNALNDGLAAIETGSTTDAERAAIRAAGVSDREAVAAERETLRAGAAAAISEIDTRISDLEARAGVSFQEALANFVPEVDASTRALNAFNAVLAEIAEDAASRRGAVLAAGVSDREGVGTERAALIAATDAAIADLEARAGITFAEALAAYVPALDATTEALSDLNTRLAAIGTDESGALGEVAAAGAADRAETDTAIAERRAAFDIDYQETTLQFQDDLFAIQYAAGQQIAEVNTNLQVLLGEIDATLSETLAVIRENKIEFDNAIFAEIREVERESAAALGAVRSDAAAMRSELEAIAAESKNNAWKDALLSMANVGITIAGVAAGAAIGGPAGAAAGAQIGGVIGGLVEDAGQELFHDPQNDLLAFRSGQLAARSRSVAFSPNAVQRQNASDFSRYFGEGFASERGSGSGGGSERPVVVQLVLNDRVLQEMSVRLSELRGQDRVYGL